MIRGHYWVDRSLILPELVPDSQQELQGAHISPELATNGPEPLFVISPKPVLDREWHIYEKTTDQPNVGSLAYVQSLQTKDGIHGACHP